MPTLCSGVAALAVASIYYLWRTYAVVYLRQQILVHQRVAYMLWVMADQPE